MSTSNRPAAAAIVRAAVDKHFPRLAAIVTFAPEDFKLIDLLARVHPDVRIFWLDGSVPRARAKAGVERIKSHWYLTPLRAQSLAQLAAEWDVEAILTSRQTGAAYERDWESGLIRINPLAASRRAVGVSR